jgi:hypothetical protein
MACRMSTKKGKWSESKNYAMWVQESLTPATCTRPTQHGLQDEHTTYGKWLEQEMTSGLRRSKCHMHRSVRPTQHGLQDEYKKGQVV